VTKKIVVLASRGDPAGMNIASHLEELMGVGEHSDVKARIILLEVETVIAEEFPEGLSPKPDLAIFASRHESQSGVACLTAHVPGNFGEATLGGRPGQVAMAAPRQLKTALRGLSTRAAGLPFEVTVEATHHGPFTRIPCFFIEIGSGKAQWGNPIAGEAVAGAVLDVLAKPDGEGSVALGLGGPHYSQRFTQLLLETDFSLSHIVPKHQINLLDDGALESLLDRSEPRPELAILDWKGMRGDDRRRLLPSLERIGLKHLRLRDALSGH